MHSIQCNAEVTEPALKVSKLGEKGPVMCSVVSQRELSHSGDRALGTPGRGFLDWI